MIVPCNSLSEWVGNFLCEYSTIDDNANADAELDQLRQEASQEARILVSALEHKTSTAMAVISMLEASKGFIDHSDYVALASVIRAFYSITGLSLDNASSLIACKHWRESLILFHNEIAYALAERLDELENEADFGEEEDAASNFGADVMNLVREELGLNDDAEYECGKSCAASLAVAEDEQLLELATLLRDKGVTIIGLIAKS